LSLLKTIERALYSRRPRRVLYNPLNDWPVIAPGDSLEPGAEPQTDYQHIDTLTNTADSIVAAAAGSFTLLPRQNNYDAQVLEVSGQTSAAVTVQLFAGGQPVSAAWSLSALEKWSAPGMIVSRSFDLILTLSAPTTFNFNVRWKPAFGRL
jgi:hypothetical protein